MQMGVALVSGPLDSLFGGCNLPAFVFGGSAAALGGIVATKLPELEDIVEKTSPVDNSTTFLGLD